MLELLRVCNCQRRLRLQVLQVACSSENCQRMPEALRCLLLQSTIDCQHSLPGPARLERQRERERDGDRDRDRERERGRESGAERDVDREATTYLLRRLPVGS